MLIKLPILICTVFLLPLSCCLNADEFGDSVIRYDCMFQGDDNCPDEEYQDTTRILGEPDGEFLSLGFGGLVEVQFDDNVLSNSGDDLSDLFIYELGADVEDTLVSIRPTVATAMILGPENDLNGDGFYEIGEVSGGVSTVDIDAVFSGFSAGELRFNAVQLIDNDFESSSSGTHGADIDAIEALEFVLLGDVNGDGAVNLLDVSPFIDLLSDGEFLAAADINGDGSVNLLDVAPFIDLLSG